MTMIDATVRLIPEVIGKEASHTDDSFHLDYWSIRNTRVPMNIGVWLYQMFS